MLRDTLVGALLAELTLLPLAWKWQLGLRRVALAVLMLSGLSGLAVAAGSGTGITDVVPTPLVVWLGCVVAACGILLYRFYRDPERAPPGRDDVIVSPADGEVIYVRESSDGQLPVATKGGRSYALSELTKTPLASRDAIVVGISLSFLDVHVNRAPTAGRIVRQRHYKGGFGSLRRNESVFENERVSTVIERDGLQLAVVLIASRLVRRIITYVSEGAQVACGQKIGAIRFGSQVDLVLPAKAGLELRVQAGDRVAAGESIVALVASRGPGSDAAGVVAPGEPATGASVETQG